MRKTFATLAMMMVVFAASGVTAAPLESAEMTKMLQEIDRRGRSMGDYKALVFIDQKRKGQAELVYEAVVYRRDAEGKQIIMFLKPQSEAGKGYLRLNKNLFLFDPSVGKWERRTERESIGGTNSRRRDFDAPSYAKDYAPTYVAKEKLGKFEVHHLKLKVKKGRDVTYPVLDVWIDAKSQHVLKVQEFALSGKLMRTSYYPKWSKVWSADKKEFVYFPKQIRIFDEIEKDNTTTIVMRKLDLKKLPSNIFTKAWVESQSR